MRCWLRVPGVWWVVVLWGGCLDQTYWPRGPREVLGPDGTWLVCSPAVATSQEVVLRVINESAGDVELGWVDFECAERPFDVVPAGQTLETTADPGSVWYVRDVATGEILAAFEVTPLLDDVVIE